MADKLPPDTPFRVAGAHLMTEQNARIRKHIPGTLSGEDPEDLHDLRVATRRLRAAMLVFRRCFNPDEYSTWYRHVSRLTEALGAVRDFDVHRAALEKRCEGLSPEEQADADAWLADLDAHREASRKTMITALKSWCDKGRGEDLDRVLRRTEGPDRIREQVRDVRGLLFTGRASSESDGKE